MFNVKSAIQSMLIVLGVSHSFCLAQNIAESKDDATQKPSYAVTQIVFPDSESTSAAGLNNSGDFVGIYLRGATMKAFAFVDGEYHAIDGTKATSINDHQVVVGFTDSGRGFHRPFRWTQKDGCDIKFMSRAPSRLGRAMRINRTQGKL